jgi:hypothetical protein
MAIYFPLVAVQLRLARVGVVSVRHWISSFSVNVGMEVSERARQKVRCRLRGGGACQLQVQLSQEEGASVCLQSGAKCRVRTVTLAIHMKRPSAGHPCKHDNVFSQIISERPKTISPHTWECIVFEDRYGYHFN